MPHDGVGQRVLGGRFAAGHQVEQPVGKLYDTVANGVRTMPAYGPQLAAADRWAIVAYVRALQRASHASIDDVPPDQRGGLK